jgi:hypothetical protein
MSRRTVTISTTWITATQSMDEMLIDLKNGDCKHAFDVYVYDFGVLNASFVKTLSLYASFVADIDSLVILKESTEQYIKVNENDFDMEMSLGAMLGNIGSHMRRLENNGNVQEGLVKKAKRTVRSVVGFEIDTSREHEMMNIILNNSTGHTLDEIGRDKFTREEYKEALETLLSAKARFNRDFTSVTFSAFYVFILCKTSVCKDGNTFATYFVDYVNNEYRDVELSIVETEAIFRDVNSGTKNRDEITDYIVKIFTSVRSVNINPNFKTTRIRKYGEFAEKFFEIIEAVNNLFETYNS